MTINTPNIPLRDVELLKGSQYGNDDDIKTMLEYFDKSTKPVFKDEKESSYIKFGSMGCNDAKVKIRRGQLMLSGHAALPFLYKSGFNISLQARDGIILRAMSRRYRCCCAKTETKRQ